MASAFVSPGLYVRENDLSLFVPSLADTPFGAVITAKWGPVNEATLITSQAQLFDTFGPLSGATNYNAAVANYPDMPGLYALDRYMRRGRRAIVVRVGNATGNGALAQATGVIQGESTILPPPSTNNTVPLVADPTVALVTVTATTGATLVAGTYTVVYTYVNANGETKPAGAGTITGPAHRIATGVAGQITVTPPATATNATSYNVYIGFDSDEVAGDPSGNEIFLENRTDFGGSDFTIDAFPTERRSNIYNVTARHNGTMGNNIQLHVGRGSNWTQVLHSKKLTVYLKSTVSNKLVQTETFDGLTADAADTVNDVLTRITATTTNYIDLALIGVPADDGSTSAGTPGALTSTGAGSGGSGSLAAGDYYVTLTYEDSGGESDGATPVQITSIPANGSAELSTESTVPSAADYVHAYISDVDGATATMRRAATATKPTGGWPSGAQAFVLKNVADQQIMADSLTSAPSVLMTGGLDGNIDYNSQLVSDADVFIGTGATSVDPATGLTIFRNSEGIQVNLLAVPGVHIDAVVIDLIDVCEVARGDCLGLIDPPPALTPDQVVKWHNGGLGTTGSPSVSLNSSYAALYWPYLQVQDSLNDQRLYLPPSGFAAEVIAFTDFISDPWFAPAGLSRGRLTNVLKAQYLPNQGDRDVLYSGSNAINPITTFSAQGIVFWGQRTLQRSPTALDRINVRRMLITARKAIQNAAISLVFQPNDSTMWRRFINTVTPILQTIKMRRGLVDFKVRMDRSNNTDQVIEQNQAVADVFLKPTKTAEIIVVNFIVTTQASTFNETTTTGTL
jgi:phage tail sheath protein FI